MMNNNFFNIYCDESCHLQNDGQPIMLFGCVWCLASNSSMLAGQLKEIMKKHHALGELKWTKVSVSRQLFYLELIDWFLSQKDLHFRGLIVLNTDFLLGIVSYRNPLLETSPIKKMLSEKLETSLGYPLTLSTSLLQNKFNLFVFSPQTKQALK